ncbi:hypothetical protein ACN5LI_001835 [Cronobacter turicensis]
MNKKKKPDGVTVMLDGDITLELNRARQAVIDSLNLGGYNGLALAPSLGALARMTLRKALGLPENKNDDPKA